MALVLAGIVALAAPLTAAIMDIRAVRRQSQRAASVLADAEFDVVSIKPVPPDRRLTPDSIAEMLWAQEPPRGGQLRMQGVSLRTLIQRAYNVKSFQVFEGPGWVSSARYDVEARASSDATFEQMRPMLRTLLADRFKLAVHVERREQPAFDLVLARRDSKLGSGLTPVNVSCPAAVPNASAEKPPPSPQMPH